MLAVVALILCGCVTNRPYRPTVGECPAADCRTGSLERHAVKTDPPTDYLLGIVEFDDQGAKLVPGQMEALFDAVQRESVNQDLSLVVFVHGWKHNAAYDDPYLKQFRELLGGLAATETQHQPGAWNRPRKVVGIYAGWRGQSVDAGELASDLTFWSRKAAAARVAQGSIRELLGRARALRDGLDRTTWTGRRLPSGTALPPGERLRTTRLLTIGHSFGGLIVYTALAQYLTDRSAAMAMQSQFGNATDQDREVAPYGDLVVIVNPAVEAISWEPIRQLLENRPAESFARRQKPVFIEVTSTADDATGVAFPLGRIFNTAVENFTSPEQRQEARTALGHYQPFLTHDLTLLNDASPPEPAAVTERRLGTAELKRAECDAKAVFERQWLRDGYLQPGWTRRYSKGATLTHRATSRFDANDPFWIVQTDKSLIADHSDISQPAFVDFVRQVYDELLPDEPYCSSLRAVGSGE